MRPRHLVIVLALDWMACTSNGVWVQPRIDTTRDRGGSTALNPPGKGTHILCAQHQPKTSPGTPPACKCLQINSLTRHAQVCPNNVQFRVLVDARVGLQAGYCISETPMHRAH